MQLDKVPTYFVDKKSVSRMHKMNPARVDREDERRMLPCRNFLDGFCPRGHRCRFYHPIPSSLPTVIRVPNLPTSFQQNSHFGQYPLHGGHHSLFSLSPTSSRSYLGLSPKLGGNTGLNGLGAGPSRYMAGMNGFSHTFGNRPVHVPVSPTYSEYEMAYAQEMEIQKEKERRATAPSPEQEENTGQNTVFSHIDWKEFLTPGARPPPPTHVPYMSNSPGKSPGPGALESLESLIRSAGNTKITSPVNLAKTTTFFDDHITGRPQSEYGHPTVAFTSELNGSDKSPERVPLLSASPPHPIMKELSPSLQQMQIPLPCPRALSAREELQFKVKQIAKELAAEPAQHVQSLDTFFRNYTFQSIPTAPSSEQDLVGGASADASPEETAEEPGISCEPESTLITTEQSASFSTEACAETTTFNPPAFSCSSESGISSGGDSASSVESNKLKTVVEEENQIDEQLPSPTSS